MENNVIVINGRVGIVLYTKTIIISSDPVIHYHKILFGNKIEHWTEDDMFDTKTFLKIHKDAFDGYMKLL